MPRIDPNPPIGYEISKKEWDEYQELKKKHL